MAHLAPRVPWESQDPSVHLEKMVRVVSVETLAPPDGKGSGGRLVRREALAIKATLERTGPRALMDPQVLQELQDREELWVFLVREEREAWLDFLVQRVPQESKAPQELREIRDPQDPSEHLGQLALEGTLALTVMLAQTDLLERKA